MHIERMTARGWRNLEPVVFEPGSGLTVVHGDNGQGKTNLVEAVDYLSRLASHRVANDAPLVRSGAERAVVRAAVVKEGRTAVLEVELNPGRANRARVNKSTLTRTRDLVGLVRTVVFSPEDLSLVKGDPSERRRFLDDLVVLRTPRLAGIARSQASRTPAQPRRPRSEVMPGIRSSALKVRGARRRARWSRYGTRSSPSWRK